MDPVRAYLFKQAVRYAIRQQRREPGYENTPYNRLRDYMAYSSYNHPLLNKEDLSYLDNKITNVLENIANYDSIAMQNYENKRPY